jgi:hypothetical protein
MAFGITPLSSVGYNFVNHVSDPVIGAITYKYEGKGGISRLFIGTSYEIIHSNANKVSVGANLSYLFGSLTTSNRAVIDGQSNSTGYLHTKISNNTFISDFIGEFGVLYRGKMNDRTHFNMGSTLNLASKLFARREELAFSFSDVVTESLIDTISYSQSGFGRIFYPKKVGFAASLEKNIPRSEKGSRRFIFSAQYEIQDWGKYSEVFDSDTLVDNMKNSRSFGFGIQYSPYTSNIITSTEKWWAISTYRLGYSQRSTYLLLDETQINQYGISFGIGIPLLNSMSFSVLNLGIEAGQRGSLGDGLIQEKYINFNLGFTIAPHRSDPWFVKRKYD